jgi:soluble cytochrome b562
LLKEIKNHARPLIPKITEQLEARTVLLDDIKKSYKSTSESKVLKAKEGTELQQGTKTLLYDIQNYTKVSDKSQRMSKATGDPESLSRHKKSNQNLLKEY